MSSTVSRNKYQSIKHKAEQWRTKALDAFEEIQDLREDIQDLREVIESSALVDSDTHNSILDERNMLLEEVNKLKQHIKEEGLNYQRNFKKKDEKIDKLTKSLIDYKDRYQQIREHNILLRRATQSVVA